MHIMEVLLIDQRNSRQKHYNDVIMSATASQITSLTIVYSIVYSRRRSKKTSKLRVTGLCEGNSPVTGEFPAQMASNAENVSIWWRHRVPPDSWFTPSVRYSNHRYNTVLLWCTRPSWSKTQNSRASHCSTYLFADCHAGNPHRWNRSSSFLWKENANLINSSPPSAAHMLQWTGSALV